MKTAGRTTLSCCLGLALVMILSGPICNESLPPYLDPVKVFEGSIEGAYVLTGSDNSVKIYLYAKNLYDETLEGPALLSGEAEISLAGDPSISKSFTLSSADLFTTRNYNPTTGVLRVDPGETLKFGVSWNLVADNGVNLRSQVFRYWEDPECGGRCIAEEERFVVSGSVVIFEKTGTALAGPSSFSLCHVNVYVDPRFCPPVDYTVPCSKRALTTGQFARRCMNP